MTQPIRIKVCGITSRDDAVAVLDAGVDAIGLVFYDKSPRAVTIKQAREIAFAVGPFVTVVGLFVNAPVDDVTAVLEAVPLHLLQFHGDESETQCHSFKRPYLKALRVGDAIRSAEDVANCMELYPSASGILLDAHSGKAPGGTGEVFNWECVPQKSDHLANKPIILAGGLTPNNVGDAIAETQPYGVDVSTGVESSPGNKDIEKIRQFVTQVRAAAAKI